MSGPYFDESELIEILDRCERLPAFGRFINFAALEEAMIDAYSFIGYDVSFFPIEYNNTHFASVCSREINNYKWNAHFQNEERIKVLVDVVKHFYKLRGSL